MKSIFGRLMTWGTRPVVSATRGEAIAATSAFLVGIGSENVSAQMRSSVLEMTPLSLVSAMVFWSVCISIMLGGRK